MVNPIDLEAPANPIVYKPNETPERTEAFRKLAAGAKANGSLIVMQISHAGRQVAKYLNPNPTSASDVQLQDSIGLSFGKPRAMTKEDIDRVVDQVRDASHLTRIEVFDTILVCLWRGVCLQNWLQRSPATRCTRLSTCPVPFRNDKQTY